MRADLLKWKYCWFDLWHKEEEGKRQSGRKVDKGKQLWRGFQLCFFCFCSTAKTDSQHYRPLWTEAEPPHNRKARAVMK